MLLRSPEGTVRAYLDSILVRRHQRALGRTVRFTVGAAVLYIVVAGSLGDFRSFVTEQSRTVTGAAVLAVIAVAVGAFFYLTRPELRPSRRAGLPSPRDLDLEREPKLRIQPPDAQSDLEAVAELAEDAFRENAMPPDLIGRLFWRSRDSVFLMKSPTQGVIGYAALLFPTPELARSILHGTVDPLEWGPDQFIVGEARWKSPYLYIDSVVIVESCRNRLAILMRHVLAYLEENYARHLEETDTVTAMALGGSPEGENLLAGTLAFNRRADAQGRRDGMALYAREIALSDVRALLKRVTELSDLLLERRSFL